MKRLFALFVPLFALFLAAGASAQEAPDVLVRNVTNEVLDIVRKDKEIQAGNTKRAVELVEVKVLPHFDFTHMTRLAVSRDWKQASPDQQKILTEEFRTLLVSTYSKALTEYRSQTVEFKPFKMQPSDTDVRVKTEIRQPGGKDIPLDYWLEKVNGAWKVYDIEVGGISLVVNYRNSFADEVRKGGIDGLIKTLQTKNKSGEAAAAKK